MGDYDSEVAAGQERVLLVWTRLILSGEDARGRGDQTRLDFARNPPPAERPAHHKPKREETEMRPGIGVGSFEDRIGVDSRTNKTSSARPHPDNGRLRGEMAPGARSA